MAEPSHRFLCPREIQVPALLRSDLSPYFFCARDRRLYLFLPAHVAVSPLLLEPFVREYVVRLAHAEI